MRGHGRSGKPTGPESYTSSLYADDFETVAQAFSLVNPIFAGWCIRTYSPKLTMVIISFSGVSEVFYIILSRDLPFDRPIAAVAADIAANMPLYTLAGIVAIGSLPCMGKIGTPTMKPTLVKLIPLFSSATDVTPALTARTEFIDALFADPSCVPFDVKSKWLGNTVVQTPDITAVLQSRRTDEARLFELGRRGLPLLVLHGKEDKLVDGDAVITLLKPSFKNMEVRLLDNSGHAVFYDSHGDTVDILIDFVRRVKVSQVKVTVLVTSMAKYWVWINIAHSTQ